MLFWPMISRKYAALPLISVNQGMRVREESPRRSRHGRNELIVGLGFPPQTSRSETRLPRTHRCARSRSQARVRNGHHDGYVVVRETCLKQKRNMRFTEPPHCGNKLMGGDPCIFWSLKMMLRWPNYWLKGCAKKLMKSTSRAMAQRHSRSHAIILSMWFFW